jgi:hypothetical protein
VPQRKPHSAEDRMSGYVQPTGGDEQTGSFESDEPEVGYAKAHTFRDWNRCSLVG